MGASKNNMIEDSFFNKHWVDDGDNVGSFESDWAIENCYPNKWKPFPFRVNTLTAEEIQREKEYQLWLNKRNDY